MKVRNSVAFVTDGNRGLGLAFAQDLLRRGAKKVYVGVRASQGNTLLGSVPVKIDVTNAAAVNGAATQCSDVTLLINNAGIARVNAGVLDPALIDSAREIFETN